MDTHKDYEAIKKEVLGMGEDVEKFFSRKNNAAGTRVRQALQKVKICAQDLRNAITKEKKEN